MILNLILLLFLISGCSSASEQEPQSVFETVNPSEAGFYADSLQKVTGFLQAVVDSNKIPGAVAMIVKDGFIAYNQAVGMTDIEEDEAIESDHVFRLASMTKTVTTVAEWISENQIGDLRLWGDGFSY